MEMKERLTNRKKIYKGSIFSVYQDEVEFENGYQSRRDLVEHSGGVGVVAFTPENKLLLVRQYRYGSGKIMLELPAGKIDPNEDPLSTAKRELEEETGYIGGAFTLLAESHPTPAYCTEKITIYHATNLTKGEMNLDPGEFLTVVEMDFNDALNQCLQGSITDSKTQVGLLTYWGKREKGLVK